MQQFAVRHSRLHIPIIFGLDAVHGFGISGHHLPPGG
jgi:hypothetical protein